MSIIDQYDTMMRADDQAHIIHTYIQIQIMILSHEKDVQYFDQPIQMLVLLCKTSK